MCPQVAPPPRAGTAPDQTVSFLTLPSTSPAGTRPERVLAPPPRTLTQEQSPRPDSNSIASEVERASETAQVVDIGIRSLDLGSPRNQKPRQRARRDWARQPKTAWTRREDCRARISHPASPHSESPNFTPLLLSHGSSHEGPSVRGDWCFQRYWPWHRLTALPSRCHSLHHWPTSGHTAGHCSGCTIPGRAVYTCGVRFKPGE